MSEFVDSVAAAIADKDDRPISPLFDDLDELRDQYRALARVAIATTLNALADEYVRLESIGDISSAGWIMAEDGWTPPYTYLRQRAKEIGGE